MKIKNVNKRAFILSISRATDVPAFYAQWFINLIHTGFCDRQNPFSGKTYRIYFDRVVGLVFWSKDPEAMFPYLSFFDDQYVYYFQFTLNDYEPEGLESKLRPLEKRIEVFCKLSERIGKHRVIWRYDPVVMGRRLGVDEHLRRIEKIGKQLRGYTERLILSFVQIDGYRRVRNRMKNSNFREVTREEKIELSYHLSKISPALGCSVFSCAEEEDLHEYGINRSSCIDGSLIERLVNEGISSGKPLRVLQLSDTDRKSFSKSLTRKDRGQRKWCQCCESRDVGAYRTCQFNCMYCYAS